LDTLGPAVKNHPTTLTDDEVAATLLAHALTA